MQASVSVAVVKKKSFFSNSLCLLKSYGNAKKNGHASFVPYSCLTCPVCCPRCVAHRPAQLCCSCERSSRLGACQHHLAQGQSWAKVGWNWEIRESCHNFVTEFLLFWPSVLFTMHNSETMFHDVSMCKSPSLSGELHSAGRAGQVQEGHWGQISDLWSGLLQKVPSAINPFNLSNHI